MKNTAKIALSAFILMASSFAVSQNYALQEQQVGAPSLNSGDRSIFKGKPTSNITVTTGSNACGSYWDGAAWQNSTIFSTSFAHKGQSMQYLIKGGQNLDFVLFWSQLPTDPSGERGARAVQFSAYKENAADDALCEETIGGATKEFLKVVATIE